MSGATDAEIERLAELCWRAYWHENGDGGECPDWRSSGWGSQLRAVARAVIADRAAQIDGLRNLLSDAETREQMQEAWANDLQRELDALRTAHAGGADLRGAISAANAWVNESGCDCVACIVRAVFKYRAAAPAPVLEAADDRLAWAEEMLRRAAGGAVVALTSEQAGAILRELERLRRKLIYAASEHAAEIVPEVANAAMAEVAAEKGKA